jgi:hypothetical protein
VVAAKLPELSDFPVASTHWFTTRAAVVAGLAMVYVVEPSTVIFPVDAPPLAEVVETVIVDPETAVTRPDTGGLKPAPPAPPPGAPDGRAPPAPPGAPDGRTPPAPPPPGNDAHFPLTAGVIATLATAVELDPGVVIPLTQDPVVTSVMLALTACVMVVALV